MKEKVPQLFNKYYGKNYFFPYSSFFVIAWISLIVIFLPGIFFYAAYINYKNDEITNLIVTNIAIALIILIIGIIFSVYMIKRKRSFIRKLKIGEFEIREIKIEEKFNDIEIKHDYCNINNEFIYDINHFTVRYDGGMIMEVPIVVYNSLSINGYAYIVNIDSQSYLLPLD